MLALGSVKSIITDSVKNGRIHFDMHGFLTNVVLADLNLSGMWAALAISQVTAECLGNLLQMEVSGDLGCCVHVVVCVQLCTLYVLKRHTLCLLDAYMLQSLM